MARRAKGEGSIHEHKHGWRVRVVINGKRIERYAQSKADAKSILDELTAGAAVGVEPSKMTVGQWLDHWLENIADLTPNTKRGYESSIRMYLKPHLGAIKLVKLQPEDLERLYRAMKDGTYAKPRTLKNGSVWTPKPLSGNTVGQAHAILHRALKVAMQRKAIVRNVADVVEPPKRGRGDVKAFSQADTMAILRAAASTDYAARWSLALTAAIRPGEALGLQWQDLVGDRLAIRRQLIYRGGELTLWDMPKTDAGFREVVLAAEVVEQLKAWRAKQLEWMLSSEWKEWIPAGEEDPALMMFTMRNGSPLKPRHDATLWARLLESAGLPHARRYTARHTGASIMLASGSDIAVVAETLGHTDKSFTLRTYVHGDAEAKAEQARRMSKLFG